MKTASLRFVLLFALLLSETLAAEIPDLLYRDKNLDTYARSICRMDLFLPPTGESQVPVLIYFHGGNLVEGTRRAAALQKFARALSQKGIAVALADYRLSPRVRFPTYVEDAAVSVAWLIRHASSYDIDPRSVFVGGYSAGGYLVGMLALDEKYLKAEGLREEDIAGFVSVSGQMFTHTTVRSERATGEVMDDAAPLFHAHGGVRPFLLLAGDSDLPGRQQEGERLFSELRSKSGNEGVMFRVISDRDHTTIQEKLSEERDPAGAELLGFLRRYSAKK